MINLARTKESLSRALADRSSASNKNNNKNNRAVPPLFKRAVRDTRNSIFTKSIISAF